MGKKLLLLAVIGFCAFTGCAQRTSKPKIVIGIVVDQMRADYLEVFQQHYGKKGLNRLMNKGAWFKNCYINYLPSYTGPGHACIYTGSVPSIHGIVGNNWYSKKNGTTVYCVEDKSQSAVGGTAANGFISPANMKVTSMADELRLATNHRSRTFAISLKDRGAVLPGGHTANAAYWMDDTKGHFMTSTFYTSQLATWVEDFNKKELAQSYLNLGWNTLNDKKDYLYAAQDENEYEGKFGAEERTSFPYTFAEKGPAYIKRTPYGNSIVFDFAREAILNEEIGQKDQTDFLAVSFSATDYVGHTFGPNSLEVEDTYARFDADLASFLKFLDKQYGRDNYLLFFTADHGAAHNPNYLKDKKVPAEYFFAEKELLALNEYLESKTGHKDICAKLMNGQVYFNEAKLETLFEHKRQQLIDLTIGYFNKHESVVSAFDLASLDRVIMPTAIKELYLNSYNVKLSGDVGIQLYPAVLDAYSTTGTSHGEWSPYDTKIPLLFFGHGVWSMKIDETVYMTDIAPTITNLLGITPPNGCIGKALLPRD